MAVSTGLQYIQIDEFTKNVQIGAEDEYLVTGDGIFDTLMETATAHLISQYNANRIRKEDYATLYAHIYEVTLQAALQAWLQKPQSAAQVELLNAQKLTEDKRPALIECQTQLACAQAEAQDKQLDLLAKQIEVADKQISLTQQQAESEKMKSNLYRRQIEGFDEDYKHKILKVMMDSWAVGFSVAKDSFQASGIPATMQKTTIDDLYNTYIKTDLDKNTYTRTSTTLSGSGL